MQRRVPSSLGDWKSSCGPDRKQSLTAHHGLSGSSGDGGYPMSANQRPSTVQVSTSPNPRHRWPTSSDIVGAHVAPRKPGASWPSRGTAGRAHDARRAEGGSSRPGRGAPGAATGRAAQQRGRVAAYPDVPVREQRRHPAAGAGDAIEHVPQHHQGARWNAPGRPRRGVMSMPEGRDAAFGQRHREAPWGRTRCPASGPGESAPGCDRSPGLFTQPAVHEERRLRLPSAYSTIGPDPAAHARLVHRVRRSRRLLLVEDLPLG